MSTHIVEFFAPSRQVEARWTSFAIPLKEKAPKYMVIKFEDGSKSFAVLDRQIGRESAVYHALVPFHVVGHLDHNGHIAVKAEASPTTEKPPSFTFSKPVLENILDLLPNVAWASPLQVISTELSDACLTGHLRSKVSDGVFWDLFVRIFSNSREVQWSGLLTHSGNGVPSRHIDLTVYAGDPISVEQIIDREFEMVDSNTVRLPRVTLNNDAAIRVWGQLAAIDDRDEQDATDPAINAILAGRCDGMALEWDRFLGWEATKVFTPQPDQPGYYAARRMGLQPNAGGTGSQQDFGPNMLPTDPSAFRIWRDSWMLPARGFDPRSSDGRPITADDHPNVRMWSMRPNYQVAGQSFLGGPPVDVLGMDVERAKQYSAFRGQRYGSGEPWGTIDDQHRSMNLDCALYALTGDRMVEFMLLRAINADRWMHENRLGAPRAIGRLLDCWQKLDRLFDGLVRQQLTAPRGDYEGILPNKIGVIKSGALYRIRSDVPRGTFETKVDVRLNLFLPDEQPADVEKDASGIPINWFDRIPAEGVSLWEHALLWNGLVSAAGFVDGDLLGEAGHVNEMLQAHAFSANGTYDTMAVRNNLVRTDGQVFRVWGQPVMRAAGLPANHARWGVLPVSY